MKLLTPQAVLDAFPRTVLVELDTFTLAGLMEEGWYQHWPKVAGEPAQFQWVRVTAVVPAEAKNVVTLEVTGTAPQGE